MKTVVFLIVTLILNYQTSFALSNYQTDYSLIDCINWSDSTWIAFDSSSPFKTLNEWIEKTIDYINSNLSSQTWNIFKIKVSCSLAKLNDNTISLNFNWETLKSDLIIEWIWDNSLIFSDLVFDVPHWKWWITFKNAKFLSNSSGYYFSTIPLNDSTIYMNYGVKIIDSYIKILPWTHFWQNISTRYYYFYTNYFTYYHFNMFQYIQNSTIDIETDSSYSFQAPLIIKDSKINFQNISSTWVYDVNIKKIWTNISGLDFDFFTLLSNEIDLGGNNFMTENTKNASFINNRFLNFNNFYLWGNDANLKYGIFINNLFENIASINISNNRNILNNVFSWEFIDTYDIRNLRKNFKLDNIWTKWIWWIFQKLNSSDMFKLNYSSSTLYKEITGQDIPSIYSSVYAIFSR